MLATPQASYRPFMRFPGLLVVRQFPSIQASTTLTKTASLHSCNQRSLVGCLAQPLTFHARFPGGFLLPLQHKHRAAKRGRVTVRSSAEDGGEESQRQSTPPRSKGPGSGWLQQLVSFVRIQQPAKLLLNLMLGLLLIRLLPINGRQNPESQAVTVKVPFSEFVHRAKRNHVRAVSVDGTHLTYWLRNNKAMLKELPANSDKMRISFHTVRPADFPTPYDLLVKNDVQFTAVDKRNNKFFNVLVYCFYVGLLITALNRLPLKLPQRGTGRRHSNNSNSTQQPVKFDDVAGVDEAKEELAEVVEFLRTPERFAKLGARPPSGVLLVGPPGTGKTLLAKAVAGEANVPFFSISASEFVELYVGMGAMRVRELFAAARKEAPAIVFIDEIDAVAKGRDTRLRSVGNDEREQTLNQLLTELDGFESDKEHMVICIAATNRPDVLDPALLRPGRFDRRVSVERPDKQGRQEILRVHIKRRKLPLEEGVIIEDIASQTTGFTGADLANLVNEAALLAGRENKGKVGYMEFDQAILRAVAGIEKKRSILQGREKAVVAKHEVGHALVSTAISTLIPGSADVEKLSIIPRSGGALGFTYIPPKTEDRALMFDSEIRGQLAMLMGGRAAEELTCGEVSTGAVDDIRRATELAYKAVSEYGLNTSVGPLSVQTIALGGDDNPFIVKGGGTMGKLVEEEVKSLLDDALKAAKDVVNANRELHAEMSRILEQRERIDKEELAPLLAKVQVPKALKQFVLSPQAQPLPSPTAGDIKP